MEGVRQSRHVFKYLNGLINVYKPANVSANKVRNAIVYNLCHELNEMQVREPRKMIEVARDAVTGSYAVEVKPNLSDDILVVGERHQMDDFKIRSAIHLGTRSSGVLVFGVNDGTRKSYHMAMNRPVRVYRVTGRFGKSTEDHFAQSRVTTRYSFDHVYPEKMNRLMASLQASHQKKMFELCGVAMDSQAAYDLAVQGPIRPMQTTMPLIYGIKCVEFKRPFFTLEIHCANESEAYLGLLVHEIALDLKTVAHCTSIRCIRCGYFSIEDSLLRHHWHLQEIINNMSENNKILDKHPSILRQNEASLQQMQLKNR